MEYQGIRYTIRTRIERREWYVTIHPDGVEGPGKVGTASGRRIASSVDDRRLATEMLHADTKAPRQNSLKEG